MSFLSVIRPHVVVRCKLSTVRSVNNSTIILLTLLEDGFRPIELPRPHALDSAAGIVRAMPHASPRERAAHDVTAETYTQSLLVTMIIALDLDL